MKKSLLAVVLATAMLPWAFAAQKPSKSASGSPAQTDTDASKKHTKKHRKGHKKSGETSTTTPSTAAPKK